MKHFKIEPYKEYDKSIDISNSHIEISIYYDDCNHTEVKCAMHYLVELLNKHWDESEFSKRYHTIMVDKWNKNEDLEQDDYESLNDFLSQNGIKTL